MTKEEFDALLEYSCSLPTGTILGKKWKRNRNFGSPRGTPPDWVVCQYVPDPEGDPQMIGIKYMIPRIRPKPAPLDRNILV